MVLDRIRTAWILVLVAVAPLVLTVGVFGQLYLSEQKQGLDREVEARSRTIAAALDRELLTQVQLLAMLAESPRLDKSTSLGAFAQVARRMQARIPNWALVRVASSDGRILMTEPPRLPTQENRIVDLDTYRQVVATGQPSIGGMVTSKEGRSGFAVRVPVVRDGVTLYVLTAVIRPQGLGDALYFNDLPRSWHVWLVDQNGNIVSSTGPASLAGRPGADFATFQLHDGDVASDGELATGEPVRAGHSALKQVGWTVHVAVPMAAYGAIRTKAWLAVGATTVVTLGLALAALVLLAKEHRVQRQREEAMSRWQRMDALGRLTGQVAHDFNNLLMVFQAGVAGMERKLDDPEKCSRYLSMMKEGTVRGAELTQRLRAYSTKSKGERELIEVREFFESLKPHLEKTLQGGISLIVNAGAESCPVMVDAKDMQTALVNLCSNARDAMRDGGTVTVTVRKTSASRRQGKDGGKDYIEIQVADTGPGFDKDAARRAFEPFFTTKSGASVGLGLTQVYGFAERSGGSVRIEAAPAGGAAVVISLPRADTIPEEIRASLTTKMPETVLIVDDNTETLAAVRVLVEEAGTKVVTAGSAEEALRILRTSSGIETLLSDVMMPEVSGIELAEQAQKEFPALKIVLMTGYSERLDQGHSLPFAVLSKPFGPNELVAALSRHEEVRHANVVPLYPASSRTSAT